MINWSEGFGGFFTRIIDWAGSGFRDQQVPEASSVLTGYLIFKGKTGIITKNFITGSLGKNEVEGLITSNVNGMINRQNIIGILTIKK